jgi:hypothetical protein
MVRIASFAVVFLWISVSIAGAQETASPTGLTPVKATETKDFAFIKQTGSWADTINKTLQRIKLPTGFRIRLYAMVPDAGTWPSGPKIWLPS